MAYSSNLNTELNKIKKVLTDLPINDIAVVLGNTLLADNLDRIHQRGKAVNGSNIGRYDTTTPMYVNPNKAPRGTKNKAKGIEGLRPPKGKNGETKFKNGKPHKTTYVKSYKDLRNRIGRRIDIVDLNFTGTLQASLNIVSKGNTADIGFISDYGATVSDALEKKYGKKIWGASDEERKTLKEVAIDEVMKYLNKNL
jgi:hypothetical protein